MVLLLNRLLFPNWIDFGSNLELSIASAKDCLLAIGENHKSLVTRELCFCAFVSGKTSFEVIVVPTVSATDIEVKDLLTLSQTAPLSSVVSLSKKF